MEKTMMQVDTKINKVVRLVYSRNAENNQWTSEDYNSDSSRIVMVWAKKAALKTFQEAIKQGNVKELSNDDAFYIALDHFKHTKPRTSDFY